MPLSRDHAAVLEALLPSGSHPVLALGIGQSSLEGFLAEFHRHAPARLWRAWRMGLFAAAWLSPLLIRRLPPIRRLAPADRERALAAMEGSRVPELRQLVSALKTVVSLHYGGLAEVREAIQHP